MTSKLRTAGETLAAELNALALPNVDWPIATPLAKFRFSPITERSSDLNKEQRILVISDSRVPNPDAPKDRCGLIWSTDLVVTFCKRLENQTTEEESADHDELDSLMENAEFISEYVGNIRGLDITQDPDLMNAEWLSSYVFLSEIRVRVLNG